MKNTVSEDFRDLRHGERGEKGMERVLLRLRESLPDLVVSVDAQDADHDLVSTRLTISGTDSGKGVLWYPPTGRRVSFSAEFVDRFSRGGELVEHDGSTDTERLLRQLGHLKEDRPDCEPHPRGPTAADSRKVPSRLCVRKAPPVALSRPTPCRPTPIATAELHFMVRVGPEGPVSVRLAT